MIVCVSLQEDLDALVKQGKNWCDSPGGETKDDEGGETADKPSTASAKQQEEESR